MAEPINVVEIIDGQKISWLQIRVALLGAITLMLDGFDNQMIAYVAPALKSAWHLSAGALGPVFSAGVFGVGLGSILIGPFGDRFGRVKTLLFTVLCFAVFSLLLAQATSIAEMTALRFGIGLVLGAVIPLVVVLCNEYAPLRHRAKMVTMMTCGYAVGAASGGFLSVHIVPIFGWQSVFYVGAVLPLLLGVALLLWMPESIRFLTMRHDNARVAAILRKIAPSIAVPADASFMMLTTGRDTGVLRYRNRSRVWSGAVSGRRRSCRRATSVASCAPDVSIALGRAGGGAITTPAGVVVAAAANQTASAPPPAPSQTTRVSFMNDEMVPRAQRRCAIIRRAPCFDWLCGR